MSQDYSKIDDALNTTSETVDVTPIKKEKVKPDHLTKDEVEKDYEYTRANLYSLIEKGQETLNGIMELAEETQSPRAYEVAGQLLKSVADTTDKFLKLQKDLKDIKEEQKGPTNVTNNAMFVGSTAELQKMLKEMNKGLGETGFLDGGDYEKAFKDMLVDERAKQMSKNGSFGLAKMMYKQLEQHVMAPLTGRNNPVFSCFCL